MGIQDRGTAKRLGLEAVQIMRDGEYRSESGKRVSLQEQLLAAIEGTVTYPPESFAPSFQAGVYETQFEVINETTLAGARRLVSEGFNPVALNFASAKNPGGGFLGGAVAQEESLCRASGLYACINGNAMYDAHRPTRGGIYTNYSIYSPGVPVFRNDEGELLDEPYCCAFVTSPAVNVGACVKSVSATEKQIHTEMAERIRKVLQIMAGHGHDSAVLGAWGCGVFRNDPERIAELFRYALITRYLGTFKKVVFSVLDRSESESTIRPFRERFAGG